MNNCFNSYISNECSVTEIQAAASFSLISPLHQSIPFDGNFHSTLHDTVNSFLSQFSPYASHYSLASPTFEESVEQELNDILFSSSILHPSNSASHLYESESETQLSSVSSLNLSSNSIIMNNYELKPITDDKSNQISDLSFHIKNKSPNPKVKSRKSMNVKKKKFNNPLNQEKITQFFPCSQPGCKKVFTRKYNLRTHESVHLGLNPKFPCNECTSIFTRKNDLLRHSRKLHS
ncbi:hypothetical protein HK099_004040 [Clydaea vesicula]|uniref:C2H2-type domain-containing protein n=1 Tax=Clydaea vesicula TaxID=447962 RepID=A0AAD5XYG8_9FUNG|nr:hypothetical protein HK099_004040 [Clydaea vesicula]KAJ3382693.1 hypothetical protein HDU92_004631 [Lobulomyces angularis]